MGERRGAAALTLVVGVEGVLLPLLLDQVCHRPSLLLLLLLVLLLVP